MAAKLYSLLESLNISSTASLSVIGTVSSGFNKFYPRKDSYLYYKNDFQVERRFSYGNIGCGLTYSFILENSIAPYGAVLSLNVGSGMTVSNCDLVVDKIISSQIGSNNTPSSNSVLSYDGDDLNWVSKLTIDDIAKFFGTTCGAGYQPVGTYSYDGYKYTLRILCEYIGPPIASTTTTTSTTCAPSDITY